MSSVVSLWYLGLAVAAGILFRLASPRLDANGRALLLAAISLGFLWKFLSLATYWPWFGAWLAATVAWALLVFHLPAGPRGWATLAGTLGLAAVMIVFKYPTYTAAVAGEHATLRALAAVEWIGLSYASFRAVDLLIQARGRRAKTLRPAVALSYLLFFGPFVAGPINRFADFARTLEKPAAPLARADIRDIVWRLSAGIIKIVALSRLAWYWSLPALADGLPAAERPEIVLSVYAYLAYIYFEFSGYCDIVIAIARIFGIRLPENFHFPFLAHNIQNFWNRWHISLSHWCRDHIFFPLMHLFAVRLPALPALAGSLVAVAVTFVFIGAWHGDSLGWVLYGCYHAAGLVTWMLWRRGLDRFAPALRDGLDRSAVARAIATAATLSFVAWGLPLTQGVDRATELARLLAAAH